MILSSDLDWPRGKGGAGPSSFMRTEQSTAPRRDAAVGLFVDSCQQQGAAAGHPLGGLLYYPEGLHHPEAEPHPRAVWRSAYAALLPEGPCYLRGRR